MSEQEKESKGAARSSALPDRNEDWWRGRAQGLIDAAEVLEMCPDPHCHMQALSMRHLARIAGLDASKASARQRPQTQPSDSKG